MRSDALVLFGATGDLAYRQIFPALQELVRRGDFDGPVVGVADTPLDLEGLRAHVHDSLATVCGVDRAAYARLASQLRYVRGDYRDPATFVALRHALAGAERPLFYMAIPPAMFPIVVERLRAAELTANARIMVEKPFGRDLATACALERALRSAFPDEAIFRIDHFL